MNKSKSIYKNATLLSMLHYEIALSFITVLLIFLGFRLFRPSAENEQKDLIKPNNEIISEEDCMTSVDSETEGSYEEEDENTSSDEILPEDDKKTNIDSETERDYEDEDENTGSHEIVYSLSTEEDTSYLPLTESIDTSEALAVEPLNQILANNDTTESKLIGENTKTVQNLSNEREVTKLLLTDKDSGSATQTKVRKKRNDNSLKYSIGSSDTQPGLLNCENSVEEFLKVKASQKRRGSSAIRKIVDFFDKHNDKLDDIDDECRVDAMNKHGNDAGHECKNSPNPTYDYVRLSKDISDELNDHSACISSVDKGARPKVNTGQHASTIPYTFEVTNLPYQLRSNANQVDDNHTIDNYTCNREEDSSSESLHSFGNDMMPPVYKRDGNPKHSLYGFPTRP